LCISARPAAMAVVIMLMIVAAQPAQAQTFNVIHTFAGGIDGAAPEAGLTLDRAGNLYGTAVGGGHGYGTVYKLTNKGGGWTFSPLYSFAGGNDGAIPLDRVVFGPNGSLYGTTSDQGEQQGIGGTVFNLRPPATFCRTVLCPWTETVLYRFPESGENGLVPGYGDLVFDHAGNLYGTTINGGAHSAGVAYELTPSGTQSVLYNFMDATGQYPYNGVIFDNAGNLYGTTYEGGNIYGTVFQLTSSGSGWTDNTLHIFQMSDGANPYGGVIFDQAGNLYGTTSVLGANGSGTIFELSPSGGTWTLNVLYNFTGSFGPYGGLTMDAAGNLYGTTFADGAHQFGSVFKLTHSNGGWTYTDLYDFTGGNDGGYPYGVVAVDASGNLYGTASRFGMDGYGVVWEITP
jgi:uncharacterized repeat protein (TIGR03803 family)